MVTDMGELSHLDELEAEAIYIIREVAAECEKPVKTMLKLQRRWSRKLTRPKKTRKKRKTRPKKTRPQKNSQERTIRRVATIG